MTKGPGLLATPPNETAVESGHLGTNWRQEDQVVQGDAPPINRFFIYLLGLFADGHVGPLGLLGSVTVGAEMAQVVWRATHDMGGGEGVYPHKVTSFCLDQRTSVFGGYLRGHSTLRWRLVDSHTHAFAPQIRHPRASL